MGVCVVVCVGRCVVVCVGVCVVVCVGVCVVCVGRWCVWVCGESISKTITVIVPVWYMYLDLSVLGTMAYIQNATPAIPPPPPPPPPPANRTCQGLSSCVCV